MTMPHVRLTSPIRIQWMIMGLALLGLGGVVGGNLYQERVNVEAREKDHLLLQTRIIQEVLDANLTALNSVLGTLGRDWVQGDTGRDINHRLETLNEALTGVRTLLILDGQGVSRAANRPELIDMDLSHREFFLAPRRNPDPDMLYISPPFLTTLGAFVINISRMIQGPDKGFAGVVTAALDPQFFIPLMRSVLYSPDMQATIVHGDGNLFLMVPDRQGAAGMNLDFPGSLFRIHRDSGRDANALSGMFYAMGAQRMMAVRTIRPAGLKTDKTMAAMVSREPKGIYARWRAAALFHGALFTATVLISSLALFVFQRRQRTYERERAEAARALADNERFMRTVTNNIPGLVAYWNVDLQCVYANHAYLEWFGRAQEQMRGITIQELMGAELFSKNEPFIRAALHGEPQSFQRTLTKADGISRYTLARYIPDERDGRVHGFFVLVSDVTELKTTQMELERRVQELDILAATDPLTGLGNRRHFLERTKEELGRSKRYGLSLVFLMLDIDHFKSVNDAHGHDVGDEVLKSLAATLQESLRGTDLIGRLGGEEFGAVLIQTDLPGARGMAERLRQTIQEVIVETKSGLIRYTASIGLAHSAGNDDSVADLMKRADLALYNAKDTGRNRVRCFGEF